MIKINSERREHGRYPYHEDVLINGKIRVEPIDIGEGGLYIFSDIAFTLGGEFEVTFPFRSGKLKVKAKIQHKQEGIGFGLKFVDNDDETNVRIKQLVDDVRKSIETIKSRMCRVLLIDDNVLSRKICKCRLISEGFKPIEVDSGIKAIEIIEAQSVDIIALNMNISKTNKFNILGMLKRGMAYKSIPLIAYSEDSSCDLVDKVKDFGADEFISFTVTTLAKFIKSVKKVFLQTTA